MIVIRFVLIKSIYLSPNSSINQILAFRFRLHITRQRRRRARSIGLQSWSQLLLPLFRSPHPCSRAQCSRGPAHAQLRGGARHVGVAGWRPYQRAAPSSLLFPDSAISFEASTGGPGHVQGGLSSFVWPTVQVGEVQRHQGRQLRVYYTEESSNKLNKELIAIMRGDLYLKRLAARGPPPPSPAPPPPAPLLQAAAAVRGGRRCCRPCHPAGRWEARPWPGGGA